MTACRDAGPAAVRIATTTSVQDSGLLPHLAAGFEGQTGIRIEPFVVGSGKAFAMARGGAVDVTITHEPGGERALLRDGVALRQRPFLANRFLLVGPASDPAGIAGAESVAEALGRIHRSGARFVSRGDESGTHVRERALWRAIGIDPSSSPGYRTLGQGMSALLRSASELEAYTLTDEATFASLRASVRLRPLVARGEGLENIYAVSLVRGPDGKAPPAGTILYEWIDSAAGERAIREFATKSGGFTPVRPG